MPKRFLVHVGPHKTGTTYLQTCFTASREALLKNSIHYPKQWQWKEQGGHADLPTKLVSKDPALVDEFARLQADDCDVVLLSAEGLSRLNPDQIRHLRSLTGDASVDIVWYVRRFSELLPSGWQEDVKHGSRATLPQYLFRHISLPGGSSVLNIHHVIAGFVSSLGASHVRLVSYSNLLDEGVDIFQHFCNTFLGCNIPLVHLKRRPNTRFGPIDAEMIRALNGLHHLQGGQPGASLRVGYVRSVWSKQPVLDVLRSAMESDLTHLKLDDGIAALHGCHMKTLQQFGDLLVNPGGNGLLFSPQSPAVEYVDVNYLSQPDAREVLWELYQAALSNGFTRSG